jgi:hypothetical protein
LSSSLLVSGDLLGELEPFILIQTTHDQNGKIRVYWKRIEQFILRKYLNHKAILEEKGLSRIFCFINSKESSKVEE